MASLRESGAREGGCHLHSCPWEFDFHLRRWQLLLLRYPRLIQCENAMLNQHAQRQLAQTRLQRGT